MITSAAWLLSHFGKLNWYFCSLEPLLYYITIMNDGKAIYKKNIISMCTENQSTN